MNRTYDYQVVPVRLDEQTKGARVRLNALQYRWAVRVVEKDGQTGFGDYLDRRQARVVAAAIRRGVEQEVGQPVAPKLHPKLVGCVARLRPTGGDQDATLTDQDKAALLNLANLLEGLGALAGVAVQRVLPQL